MCPADVVIRTRNRHQPRSPAARPIREGARPMRIGRSTSALVPLEARSTARTGGPTSCGPWVPTGLPHTRQLVALGSLACPLGQSTASIASSSEPADVSGLGGAAGTKSSAAVSSARFSATASSSFCGAATRTQPGQSQQRRAQRVQGQQRQAQRGQVQLRRSEVRFGDVRLGVRRRRVERRAMSSVSALAIAAISSTDSSTVRHGRRLCSRRWQRLGGEFRSVSHYLGWRRLPLRRPTEHRPTHRGSLRTRVPRRRPAVAPAGWHLPRVEGPPGHVERPSARPHSRFECPARPRQLFRWRDR